jgi:hypothetical protein
MSLSHSAQAHNSHSKLGRHVWRYMRAHIGSFIGSFDEFSSALLAFAISGDTWWASLEKVF